MKRKALIGLGQSGSAVVEDIAPYASGFDVYCINSSEINGRFLKKIPERNRYFFGLETGFAREFEKAQSYLKGNGEAGRNLMAWIQEVVEKYEEIIWVTYSRSGTGIGTLLYVLQEMQKGAREAQTLHNTSQFNIILRRKHETPHAIAYPQKDIMKEWLYLSEYEHSESLLFIEYSFTIKERLETKLADLHIKKKLRVGRLSVLDILHHQKLYQSPFIENKRKEFIKGTFNFLYEEYYDDDAVTADTIRSFISEAEHLTD